MVLWRRSRGGVVLINWVFIQVATFEVLGVFSFCILCQLLFSFSYFFFPSWYVLFRRFLVWDYLNRCLGFDDLLRVLGAIFRFVWAVLFRQQLGWAFMVLVGLLPYLSFGSLYLCNLFFEVYIFFFFRYSKKNMRKNSIWKKIFTFSSAPDAPFIFSAIFFKSIPRIRFIFLECIFKIPQRDYK